MSWREHLQPASFRGVNFKVQSHNSEFGRRVVTHEFPLRDKPYTEDLGRKARGYQIEAYVLGTDYMVDRDALRQALEKKGPGTLVHRYLGQMRVQVTDVRLKESNKEGGMATFSISFVEAGELPAPVTAINTQELVKTKSDIALQVLQAEFETDYTVAGFPAWILSSAQDVLTTLEDSLSIIGVVDAVFGQYISLPSQLASQVIRVLSGLTASSLLSNVTSLVNSFASNPNASISTVLPLSRMFDFGDDLLPVPTTVLSRQQQASNQKAIINIVRRSAMVEAARQASQDNYSSQQQAILVRDQLADALDTEMLTASDDSYIALQDIRSALIQDMTERSAQLKRIRSYTPKITEPALVIAHRLYQNALQDQDIVNRNSITHPGFILGGAELEVINA